MNTTIGLLAVSWPTLASGEYTRQRVEDAKPVFNYLMTRDRKVAIIGCGDTETLVREVLPYDIVPNVNLLVGGENEIERLVTAYREFKLGADNVLYLSDSPENIRAARILGTQTAALSNGPAENFAAAKPDYLLHDLSELKRLCNGEYSKLSVTGLVPQAPEAQVPSL